MKSLIRKKSKNDLVSDELRLMRMISEPNHSFDDIGSFIHFYSGMMNSIQEPHVRKINKLMTKFFRSGSDVTEEMRTKLIKFCEKQSALDRFSVAYVQIAAFHATAKYFDNLRSVVVKSTNQQHVFLMNLYAANWWMNLFLDLHQNYPRHLELFNALGEIHH